jgi:hypothetical protein
MLLSFQIKGMEVHYIVEFNGELGSGSNGSNEPKKFSPQRPIFDRMLILDDMHWK